MSKKKECRVAVVGGAGVWGRRYMRAYAERDDSRIVALVDKAVDRRDEFAKHYGAESVFDSVEELFAQTIPDVVSVIVPVSQNPKTVIACARAGVRSVSCEKPIAASLEEADEVVRVCRECGTDLACSTMYWEAPHLIRIAAWLREGHLGKVTDTAMPSGISDEVSGAGCVHFTLLRLLTGQEVTWAEGWALPPNPQWMWPPDATDAETDSTVHGRLGLTGGTVCQIPLPDADHPKPRCTLAVTLENGRVWICPYRTPIIVEGHGPLATPIFPKNIFSEPEEILVEPAVRRLVESFQTGEPVMCTGDEFRTALEIAIAMKQSAHDSHRRIELPLTDRTLRLFPHHHRLRGGDSVGWDRTQYRHAPEIV